MKINTMYFILLLFSAVLHGQVIKTNWTTITFDSTMANHAIINSTLKGAGQAATPFSILSDKDNNIYLLNYGEYSWQVEKITSGSGKSLWKTSRNYTTPTLDSNQYFISDFFMNNDNTVEALGTQISLKYPYEGLFVVGAAAKGVYDTKTGKEKAYYYVNRKNKGALIWNRGSYERFLKKKDGGYFIMDPLPYESAYGILRKLKSNLTKVDTIKMYLGDKKSKGAVQSGSFQPYFINNSIYYTTGMFDGVIINDSTQFNYRWFKLDTLGNILKQKDLNKEVYGVFGWMENKQISDGFLWTGATDTTYSGVKKDNYHYYVTKVDTNMNVKWRVFLPAQESRLYLNIRSIELQDQKGYLIFLASRNYIDAKTWLYHVSMEGKATYLGKVELNNTDEDFFPLCTIQLPNKDIALGYGLLKCWVKAPSTVVPCGGAALIKYSQIEKVVSSKEVNSIGTSDAYNIFPNPADNLINLHFSNPEKGILALFDAQGETIKEHKQTIANENWQLPIQEISSGIYFLQIRLSNGEIRTEKVIVQH